MSNETRNETRSRGGDTLNYQEQIRRQTILNSLENRDYLLIIASQQQKSVQQVKYELMMKLMDG